MSQGTKVVRVRPPTPDNPIVIQRHTVGGVCFRQGHGWYEVPDELADLVAGVHVNVDDERSPLAFDVFDSVAAAKAHEAEVRRKEEEKRAALSAPRVVAWQGQVRSIGKLPEGDQTPATDAGTTLQPPRPPVPAPGTAKADPVPPAPPAEEPSADPAEEPGPADEAPEPRRPAKRK